MLYPTLRSEHSTSAHRTGRRAGRNFRSPQGQRNSRPPSAWPRPPGAAPCGSSEGETEQAAAPRVFKTRGSTRRRLNRLLLSRRAALFPARGCVDHFKFFTSHNVITLVSNHAHGCAPGGLLGFVHQQLQFQLAVRSFLALLGQLLAVVVIIFARTLTCATRLTKRSSTRVRVALS